LRMVAVDVKASLKSHKLSYAPSNLFSGILNYNTVLEDKQSISKCLFQYNQVLHKWTL
jgi:hypothetical protein